MTNSRYETLRNELERMEVPEDRARILRWLADLLTVGRTTSGHFEIFICGNELRASSGFVRRHMQHGDWQPLEGRANFSANRVVLPQAPHFASIAAVIAVELLRSGVSDTDETQFACFDVEPIIELATRRGALPENVVAGLVGELILLRQLFIANSNRPTSFLRVLDFWQGWQQEGGRDFRLGGHSIEVKATQASSSIHKFTGLYQVEPTLLPDGRLELLSILSIGLAASTTVGESLPQIVNDILSILSRSPSCEEISSEFLRRVSLYGQSGRGYEHSSMQEWSVYDVRYAHTFEPRLFRVNDPAFAVLTREMLSTTFVQADDLSFTAHFPDQVSAFNPVPNWETEIQNMQAD